MVTNARLMKLTDRIQGAMASLFGSPANPEGWTVWGRRYPTNSSVSVDEHVANTMSAVWACMSVISNSVAMLPVRLVQKSGDEFKLIENHPVADILALGFNPDMSSFTGRYAGQAQVSANGNAYFQIQRSPTGQPQRLFLLETTTTYPYLMEDVPYDLIDYYQTTYRGITRRMIPEDVVHIRGHATRGVVGLSPITAAREAIGLGLVQEKFGAKFFANDSKSGGYLMQPEGAKTNGRQQKTQGDAVAQDQGGPDNAWKLKVLDPGAKFIATHVSQEDAQFLQSRAFQLAEVCRFFGVPLVFVDSTAATAWGSGIESFLRMFVLHTVQPVVARWEDELSRKLLTQQELRTGFRVVFDLDEIVRGDTAARAQLLDVYAKHRILSRNELRVSEGHNPSDAEGMDDPNKNQPAPPTPAPGAAAKPPGNDNGNQPQR